MSMHVHLRILHIYFLRYQGNSYPENFHQLNSLLVNAPLENSNWNIPAHFFKYSRASFLNFLFFIYLFFSLLFPLSLILLKTFFCNSMFQRCWSLYEGLSKERQLMKWVGILQVRIFWVAIFQQEVFQEKIDGWEFFWREFPRGEFF